MDIPIITVQSARDFYAGRPQQDKTAVCNRFGGCALALIWKQTFPGPYDHVTVSPRCADNDPSYPGDVMVDRHNQPTLTRKLTATENTIAARFDELDGITPDGKVMHRQPHHHEIVDMLDQMLAEGYE